METTILNVGLAVVALCLASLVLRIRSRHVSLQRHPPSPTAVPFVGHPLHVFRMSFDAVTRTSRKLGGSHMLRFFSSRLLFLNTFDDMKEAMVNQADCFPKAKSFKVGGLKVHEKTFLFTDGPVWKEKRRFTLHHLRNLGFGKSTMEDTIMDEFGRVCAVIDRKRTISFNAFFFFPVLNILWGIVAGKTYQYGDEQLARIGEAITATVLLTRSTFIGRSMRFLRYVPGDPFGLEALEREVEIITSFIEKQIDEHLESLSDGEPRDYMEAYLQEIKKRTGHPLTEETACYERGHLVGALYDILLAGADTTSTTLEWALLYMALWPKIQKKLQDELDTVIGRNRLAVYSDNTSLPYVRATIMEIQRYSSVIPLCSPRLTNRQTNVGGYTISEGTLVFQNIYSVHHDKKLWGDPEVFRPERFLTADGKAEKTDGWMPFSLGPRFCPGESLARMELFLFFSGLMQRYSFQCVTGKPLPTLEPSSSVSLTIRPRPFQLVVSPRRT